MPSKKIRRRRRARAIAAARAEEEERLERVVGSVVDSKDCSGNDPPAEWVEDPRVRDLQLLKKFEDTVNMVNCKSIDLEDCREISLPADPDQEDLVAYGRASITLYKEVGVFSIPVKIDGEKKFVSVTAAKPNNMENCTFHIVIMVRAEDGSEVYFLIEHFSNYLRAVRIVLRGQQSEGKPRLVLREGNTCSTLPRRFKP